MTARAIVAATLVVLASAPAAFAQGEPDVPEPAAPAPAAPAPAAPAPAAPAPAASDDDATLDALGLEAATADDELQIYGFADVGLFKAFIDKRDPVAGYLVKETTFYTGNLNVYLTKKLGRRWRSMLEVRLVSAPAGKVRVDGTFEDATGPDPAETQRPVQWGGVSIERAYLEYEVSDWLSIQAGTYLTPYGIWNVDHGAPAIIPTTRPYIIGEDLFPERQTGLHVYGKAPVGDYTVGYHATLSNGRGPLSGFRDLDENKAFGGRLVLDTQWLGGIRIGVSAYHGRSTDRPADRTAVDADGNLINITPAGTSFLETAWAADVRWQRGPLLVQSEVIINDRTYRAGAYAVSRSGAGFIPNSSYSGIYLMGAYRLDRLRGITPFAVGEVYRPPANFENGDDATTVIVSGGLNYRPIPSVVLKASVGRVTGVNTAIPLELSYVDLRAAWVF